MSTLAKVALSMTGHLKPNRARERAIGMERALPPPRIGGGLGLGQALAARCSRREFSTAPLPEQELSNVLWAAFGINRRAEKGRTAPTALGAQEIDVYAAMPGGLYIYEPVSHSLRLVSAVDARNVTGFQDFVDAAPLDLIYVADHSHMAASHAQDRLAYSAVAAGAIAQNVYLYCAAAGLAAVVRAWFDRAALAGALGLGEREHVIVAQTVGYPAPTP